MITKKGIDVSKWQGVIDWAKVKAAGIQFAIIRAGYGSYASQKDKQFDRNYSGAKGQGLPVGAYWYSYATTVAAAKKEAAAFLAVIAGKSFDFPLFFDQEYEPGILALTNAQRTAICKTFCDAVKAGGFNPGVYASTDFINNRLNYAQLTTYPIWVAQYGSKCTAKVPVAMWQYSSKGSVAGITGNVDMDYFYIDDSTKNDNPNVTESAPVYDDWAKAKCKDDAAKYGKAYTVNCNTLYFRKGAGTDQSPIRILKRGTKLMWYGYYTIRDGITWLYVAAPDGVAGFVSKGHLKA